MEISQSQRSLLWPVLFNIILNYLEKRTNKKVKAFASGKLANIVKMTAQKGAEGRCRICNKSGQVKFSKDTCKGI